MDIVKRTTKQVIMKMSAKFKMIIVITTIALFTGFLPSYAAALESNLNPATGNGIQDTEIIKFLKTFSRTYKKGEVDEYIEFYSTDALENGENTFNKIKGDYLNTIAQNIVTVFELEVSDIKNLRDSAIVDAFYNKTVTEKSKGASFSTSGDVRIKVIKEKENLKIAVIDYDNHIKNDYIIGAEDVIEVSVWKSPDLSTVIMVRPDGMISLPLIGDIRTSNRTAKELKDEIEHRLAEYKQDPIVSIIIREANSQVIYVTGEVVRPGKYPLKSETTIIQAITLAGGLTQWANKDKIVILRKSLMNPDGNRINIKYSDIVSGKNMKANVSLKPGDTVIVP